jgi:arylsulfatase A-like enzyme
MDKNKLTYPKLLRRNGYQTAAYGKWHLGEHREDGEKYFPDGFDDWAVLPGQGSYHDPEFIFEYGKRQINGYVTDIITDMCLDFLKDRDREKPFCMLCHHKAPHRSWEPDEKHAHMYDDLEIPYPETFEDDYSNRASAASAAEMRVTDHLFDKDLKEPVPEGLSQEEEKKWKYQRYIKDYLRCVASVDDNVGRLLDYLEKDGIWEDTIVVYTSDQGFFLGDHGWYDKRFMYEESLRMPFVISYPKEIKAGSVCEEMLLNIDFAETFLDFAGVDIPSFMQGRSFRQVLKKQTPADWRKSMYYRYWMHKSHHNVYAHYGIRTHDYKLIYYYSDGLGTLGSLDEPYEPEWELFDLRKDRCEMRSVYGEPEYADIVKELKDELHRIQADVGDDRYCKDID